MRMILNILIFLFAFRARIIDAFTLKSSHMCIFFNTANTNRITNECVGNLKFQCTDEHCSLDKRTCDSFLEVKAIIRTLQRMPIYEAKVEEYKNFVRTMKFCPIREKYLSLLSYDVCNRQNENNVNQKIITHTDLTCSGKNSIPCDQMTCGATRNDCIAFKLSKKTNKLNSNKLLDCGQLRNQKMKKKFLF